MQNKHVCLYLLALSIICLCTGNLHGTFTCDFSSPRSSGPILPSIPEALFFPLSTCKLNNLASIQILCYCHHHTRMIVRYLFYTISFWNLAWPLLGTLPFISNGSHWPGPKKLTADFKPVQHTFSAISENFQWGLQLLLGVTSWHRSRSVVGTPSPLPV